MPRKNKLEDSRIRTTQNKNFKFSLCQTSVFKKDKMSKGVRKNKKISTSVEGLFIGHIFYIYITFFNFFSDFFVLLPVLFFANKCSTL